MRANNDTFHFTNRSLQASPFNRSRHRWQGLVQFLLERHAKKEQRRRIVVAETELSVENQDSVSVPKCVEGRRQVWDHGRRGASHQNRNNENRPRGPPSRGSSERIYMRES